MGEGANSLPRPKPTRRLTGLGVALTVLYLIGIGSIALTHRDAMIALEPNEWGDYLAGVFGPLAFLWLVLGYFQQGDELRYSAEALWLQGEELRNSVEQQQALVEVTKEQITFEKQSLERERAESKKRSQPILFMQYVGFQTETNRTQSHNVNVENTGQDCTDVRLLIEDDPIVRQPLLKRGESISGSVSLDINAPFQGVRVDVAYTDINGNEERQSFRYENGEFLIIA